MMSPATLRADPRLDRPPFLAAADRAGMLRLVEGFPAQFEAGSFGDSSHYAAVMTGPSAEGFPDLERRVWIAAMGGSAFAGDMTALALGGPALEISVVRSFRLPAAARAGDLVLALSYSGDTAETLSAYHEAGRRGIARVAVTSGGALARAAAADHVASLGLPAGLPPRAAAGYAFTAAWHALKLVGAAGTARPGAAAGSPADPPAVGRHLSAGRAAWVPATPGPDNPAKKIASWLDGRFPFLYAGSGPAEAALLRWRTQLNENAKVICHTSVLPEMDHNEIVGWSDAAAWRDSAAVLFLREGSEDAATARCLAATREWLAEREIRTLEVVGSGPEMIQRLWWLCHLGDYVSVYLAALKGIDPTPVTAIDELKRKLAEESL